MGEITYVRSSFAGGEWSQMAQGRFHDPKYRTALSTCFNFIPVETEAAVRRPGFQTIIGGTTRSGVPGRVLKFDFQGNTPYTMEFTDLHLRLLSGQTPVTTNDSQTVSSISNGNPVSVGLPASSGWHAGDQVYFTNLTSFVPLQNRLFTVVNAAGATVTLADAITGANINGVAMGAYTGGATLNRVLDIATPYVGGSWQQLRSLQTDNLALLLHPGFAPQSLGVKTQPSPTAFATFAFGAATFLDGPYLDPPTNGALVTPNLKTGIVQLAVSFPQWLATTSYPAGAFVTNVGVNYVSLADQNLNATPASNPSKWALTSPTAAINNGGGFTNADLGRLIRLFSEPPYWLAATTYAVGAVVSYNPTGLPGQTTYWGSLVGSNVGNAPGTDLTHWQILELGGQTNSPAIWTWGKIVSLVNFINTGGTSGGGPGTISGQVGDMISNGGLAAAFNGNLSQPRSASAVKVISEITIAGTSVSHQGYVGAQFSAGVNLQSVTVTPPNNTGMLDINRASPGVSNLSGTLFFYANTVAPGSFNDGTVLGTRSFTGFGNASGDTQSGTSPITIPSHDTATFFNFAWVVLQLKSTINVGSSYTYTFAVGQVQFVSTLPITGGTASTSGINVELLGPSLLYTAPIVTWRLGVYGGPNGFPTCGTYAEGRVWLAGSIPNRVDASVANGIANNSGQISLNFAPTDQYGNVLDSSGISAVFDAPDANPILWMLPDLQGILAGTQASEWLISAPSGGGFSPTNIAVRRATRIGSANIEPTKTEHTVVFVQKFLRNVMEYFADVFSGKFTAPKLTINAKHLTTGNLQEIAYQQELCPIVWARVNNGLIGCTYKRDTLMTSQGPTLNGWHRHTLGSGWQVVSICTGSSVNGNLDALTIVSFNPATGLYYVEVLTDILDEGTPLCLANYVDESVNPTSFVTTNTPSGGAPYGGVTLGGLWYLNGFTVTAMIGGLDCGDYTVANGSIFVPYGDGFNEGPGSGLFTANFVSTGITANGNVLFTGVVVPTVVGFTYTSTGQITRPIAPEESGARAGPGYGKLRRSHYIIATFVDTQGVSLGFDGGTLSPVIFTKATGVPVTIDGQFSGLFRDRFPAEYNFRNEIEWQVTRPYICNVTSVGAAVETADI